MTPPKLTELKLAVIGSTRNKEDEDEDDSVQQHVSSSSSSDHSRRSTSNKKQQLLSKQAVFRPAKKITVAKTEDKAAFDENENEAA